MTATDSYEGFDLFRENTEALAGGSGKRSAHSTAWLHLSRVLSQSLPVLYSQPWKQPPLIAAPTTGEKSFSMTRTTQSFLIPVLPWHHVRIPAPGTGKIMDSLFLLSIISWNVQLLPPPPHLNSFGSIIPIFPVLSPAFQTNHPLGTASMPTSFLKLMSPLVVSFPF